MTKDNSYLVRFNLFKGDEVLKQFVIEANKNNLVKEILDQIEQELKGSN